LTDNASLSSTEEMSLATLDTNGYGLMLASAASDLTITDGVTIRYPAGGGPTINSGEADLTLDGTVIVPDGGPAGVQLHMEQVQVELLSQKIQG